MPLEEIVNQIPGGAAYKWNDRNLKISPLLSQGLQTASQAVAASTQNTATGAQNTTDNFTLRSGLWITAAVLQVWASDAASKLQLLSASLTLGLAGAPANPPPILIPAAIGTLVPANAGALIIPAVPPQFFCFQDPAFQIASSSLAGSFLGTWSYQATALNLDGAAPHTLNINGRVWYRLVEGMEP